MYRYVAWILALSCLLSCDNPSPLPMLGTPVVTGKDTVYPRIPAFSFWDQDSSTVTEETFRDNIYVADFIFLSCPTICPRMTGAMKTVYTHFLDDDRVKFLSHTIDPERDSIPRLHAYAQSLGVATSKWHFVTGDQDRMIDLAQKAYYATAYADSTAPGGWVHSAALLLIDRDRHIRGVYNSTLETETRRLIEDINILLREAF